ncbi:MAG: hypothetical protein HW416_842 [Chloroflexi bacterium]|nr:hypothetical protein [Chloroflexota bacterium]
MIKRLLAVTILVTMLLPAALLSATTASAQCSYAAGTPIQLVGTPHLFIADAQGVLHWGGDTRALAGHVINWGDQCAVSLSQLTAARRGDPWLTAGLPKIGDPIYLAKWEDTAAAPTLLHIQSIADLELFGINTSNYGNFVLDRATWEQKFGVNVGALRVGPLASAASFAWSELDRNAYGRLLPNMQTAESAALAQGVSAGTDAAVALNGIIVCERGGLATFESGRNEDAALQGTRDCLAGPVLVGSPMAPQQMQPLASGSSDGNTVRIESPGVNSTASGQRQFTGFAVNCSTGAAALQLRIFRGTTSAGVLMNIGAVGTESRDLAQVCSGSGLTGTAPVGWTTTVDTVGSPDGMQVFTAVADFPGGSTARDSLSITLANNTGLYGTNGVTGCQNGYVATSTYGCQPIAATNYAASICPVGFSFTATGCQMATFGVGGGNCPAGSTYTTMFGCQVTTGTQACPSGQVAAIAFGCTNSGTQQCQVGYVSTALYGCQAGGTAIGPSFIGGLCSAGSTYINNGCVYTGGVNNTTCQAGMVSTSAYGCLPVGSTSCATGMVSTSLGCLAAGATGANGGCQAGYYYLQNYGCVHS